ncbi:MAG: hypothetical protein ACK5JT_15400 [Hyphomicrobiaceae bacterium]
MYFGKRTELSRPSASGAPPLIPGDLGYEHIEGLHLALVDLLKSIGRISSAIHDHRVIPVPVVADQPDPEAGPVKLKGFADHFAFIENDRITHTILALAPSDPAIAIDTGPQRRLADALGRIRNLNLFCQQAQLDDAIGVALQSPHIPAFIDETLAEIAWLATFTDRAIAALPEDMKPTPSAVEVNVATPETGLQDRYLRMAADMMLTGARIIRPADRPGADPAMRPVMLPVAPHTEDYFINGVYLPAADACGYLDNRPESAPTRNLL